MKRGAENHRRQQTQTTWIGERGSEKIRERGAKAQADVDLPVLFAEYQMQMKNRTFVLFFYVLLSLHLL